MKKNILLFAILLASCTAPVEEPKGVGFWAADAEETFVLGSDETTQVFNDFIEAHNNRDTDLIKSMETEDIHIELPDGTVKDGQAQHMEALGSFFDADAQWLPYWGMPYKGVKNGVEWMIAGMAITTLVDGEETTVLHMVDAELENGLFKNIYVYENRRAQSSE